MCGIAGFETCAGSTPDRAEALLGRLATRGPDGSWWEEIGSWALAQTRLAVVDLSQEVRYPMPNEDGRLQLLFNGEVYNHRELRRELEGRGHRFRTACDAEVVLHGFEEWGDEVFARLNGMWALALLDATTEDLTLARDARGIKPLVMTSGRRPFAFASDAFSLVAAGLSAGVSDRDAIAEFVAFHYVPGPATGIADLQTLAPGTVLHRTRDGQETLKRWAPPVFGPEIQEPPGVSLEEARAALKAAVARQLKADVPVGVFLSGGIDSALVLKYALEAGARPIAFTLGFAGAGDYDEAPIAATVAAELGVEHRVETIKMGFQETVEAIGSAFDSPLADPSAIAMLPLARFARDEVTVALSGTGGDDLFAGYYRHRALRLRRLLNAVPRAVRQRFETVSAHRGEERKSLATLLSSYMVRMSDAQSSDDRSLYLSLVGTSTSGKASGLFFDQREFDEAHMRVARRHGLPHGDLTLDHIQTFELETYLCGDLLVKEDRSTMASGLEGRVPFLDDEVVAVASRTRPSQRARMRSGKVILRRLARRDLGSRLAATRKRGFAVPLGPLFRNQWQGDVADWLTSSPSEFIDLSAVPMLMDDRGGPPLDLWAMIALSAWERELSRLRKSAVPLARAEAGPADGRGRGGGLT